MSADSRSRSEQVPRLFSRTVRVGESSVFAEAVKAARILWISPGTKLAALGTAWRLAPPRTSGRFKEASSALMSLLAGAEIEDEVDVPGSGPIAFGAFSFDWQEPGSELVVPSAVYGMSDTAAWKTEIRCVPAQRDFGDSGEAGDSAAHLTTQDRDGGLPDAGRLLDGPFAEWQAKFARVKRRLDDGELQKVVLARKVRMSSGREVNRQAVIRVLAREFPGCYTFSFADFIGSSPELLVRKLGQVVDSIPIAGSAPRGADETTDARLGRALMDSAKDQMEHELTKQAVVHALTPYCSDIEAEPEPSLLLLNNVQHLSTKVQGRLDAAVDSLELVGALHPTPAVCGVPPEAALETIRTVEGFGRGRYAGPIGWIDHRGDGEWAVALRCAELGPSSATLFAGAGLVAGSDERSEFEETELKLDAIRSALAQA